jgi:chromosome segregation ATPase
MRRIIDLFIILLILPTAVFCQSSGSERSVIPGIPDSQSETKPKNIEENLAKLRIDRENKEFREMLRRGEEALKAAEELAERIGRSADGIRRFQKELTLIEKNLKKIRSDLGGSDDKGSSEESGQSMNGTLPELLKRLRDDTAELLKELRQISRFTISAAAIETVNSALRLLKQIRIPDR